uniref:Uncharacterized protein n=1 Tax=Strombidium rassoulzadegani TaxID=1082188 RepID=A0A7S3CRW8_9SPIT|mmetsp:Transcript_5026/g.8565  ORF Transcript_5026/g.8565 Transcript_5026/m.8565 type:complete len:112 (+) Transcript_5026:224-559(+)
MTSDLKQGGESKPCSTRLIDDIQSSQALMMEMMDANQGGDEEDGQKIDHLDKSADFAEQLSKRIMLKIPSLKQLMVSFNLDRELVGRVIENDQALVSQIQKHSIDFIQSSL